MNSYRKLLVLLLSVMMVFTLIPTVAFAAEEKPELVPEVLWDRTESWSSPHFLNVADVNALDIVSVVSSDTDVLEIRKFGEEGTIYDYILWPVSAGTSTVTVTYVLDGVQDSTSAVYTIKPFPIFLTDLAIDDVAVDTGDYYYHNYYDIYGYEGTSPNIRFNIPDGWNFDYAYGNCKTAAGIYEGISVEGDYSAAGWTVPFPEDSTDLNVFFAFYSDEGDSIQLGIRFYRGGDDPYGPGGDYPELPEGTAYIDDAGMICWEPVEGADHYDFTVGYYGVWLNEEDNGEYNVWHFIDTRIKNGDFEKASDNEYDLFFRAYDEDYNCIGELAWTYYYETEAEYVPPGELDLTITDDGRLITEYAGAEEYRITLTNSDVQPTWSEPGSTLDFDLKEMIIFEVQFGNMDPSTLDHHILVEAVCDEVIVARGEADFEFTVPEQGVIENLTYDSETGDATWSPVDGTYYYYISIQDFRIFMDYPRENLYSVVDQGISEGLITAPEDDTYVATVYAVTKRGAILATGSVEFTYDSPVGTHVDMNASITDGILTWEPVEGAEYYRYYIDYRGKNTEDLSADLYAYADHCYTRGLIGGGSEHTVQVVAYKGDTIELGSWEGTLEYTPTMQEETLITDIYIGNINSTILPGEMVQFTTAVYSDDAEFVEEYWQQVDGDKMLTEYYDDIPLEGETYRHCISFQAPEGYKFADNDNLNLYVDGVKTIPDTITRYSNYFLEFTGSVPQVTVGSDEPGEKHVTSIDFSAFPRLRKDVDASLSATAFEGDTVTLNYSDGTSENYVLRDHEIISETTGTTTEESSRIVISYDSDDHVDFAAYYNGDIRLRADDPSASFVAQGIELISSGPVELIRGLDSITMTDSLGNEYEEYNLERLGRYDKFLEDDAFKVTYRNGTGEVITVDYVYDPGSGGFTLSEDSPCYTGYPSDDYAGTYFTVNMPDQSVNHFEVGQTYSMSVTYHEYGSNFDLTPLTSADDAYGVFINQVGPEAVTEVRFTSGSSVARVKMGEPLQLAVYWEPDYAVVPAEAITWVSMDPSVAAVDENGLVTPVSVGSTQVMVQIGNRLAYKNVEVWEEKVLTDETVSLSQTVFPYTGNMVGITDYVLYKGNRISSSNLSFNYTMIGNEGQQPKYIGDVKVVITGVYGGYTGTATKYYTIKGDLSRSATNVNVTLDADEYTYNGSPVEPRVESVTAKAKNGGTATLVEGVDYTVSYMNNEAPGTGFVFINAVSDSYYMGMKSIPFTITEPTEAPAAPVISAELNANGKPVISWDPVDGAAKYDLLKATSPDGPYTRLILTVKNQITHTGAVDGTTYYYKAMSVDADGNTSDDSNVVSITPMKPLAPPTVTASLNASGKPVLSWDAVDGASKYEVFRANSADGTYTRLILTVKNQITHTGAVDGNTYYYKVRSVDADGNTSDYGDVVSITAGQPLAAPTVRASLNSSGKPVLSWDPVDGASKYEVFRANSEDGTYTRLILTVKTQITHTGAVDGNTYFYKVRSVDADGNTSDYGNTVSITAGQAMAAPTVAVSLNASGKPVISWDPVDGAAKYDLWKATSPDGPYTRLILTVKNQITHTGAVDGTTYYYKAMSVDANGNTSDYGNVASITAGEGLAAPTVKVSLNASGKPVLSWDAVDGAAKYDIYKATSPDGTYSRLILTVKNQITHTGAVDGNTYYYKVKSVDAEGNTSDYGNVVSITAGEQLAPPVVTASLNASGKPVLTWDAVPGAAKYDVYKATSPDGQYTRLILTVKTQITHTGAVAGNTYYYKVMSVDADGNTSDYGDVVCLTV